MENFNEQILRIAKNIREGILDVNVQELFMSNLIKGLLYNLNKEVKIRGIQVPHMILHTGDDRLWIEQKGYDAAAESSGIVNVSNENNVYSIIPKCIVNPANIDLDVNQLTSPYSQGTLQYEIYEGDDMGIYSFSGEFRRIPLKLAVELKYYVDSYTDMLELIQYIISHLLFIRTFDIMYMGQKIKCSYKIPENFAEEHTMELDGATADNKNHVLNLSIEVESNVPVFNNKTIVPTTIVSANQISNVVPKKIL